MVLTIGLVVLVAMLGLCMGLVLCAAVVARRSDTALEADVARRLDLPVADEPAVVTRRFARDPRGRPIAAPQHGPTASVARN